MRNIVHQFSNNVLSGEHINDPILSKDIDIISVDGDDNDIVNVLIVNYVPAYLSFENLEKLSLEVRNEVRFFEKIVRWKNAKSEQEQYRVIEQMIEEILYFYHPNIHATFNQNTSLFNDYAQYTSQYHHWLYKHDVIIVFEGKNKIDFSYRDKAKTKLACVLCYELAHILLHLTHYELNIPEGHKMLVIPDISERNTIVNNEAEIFAINLLLPFSSLKAAILNTLEENSDGAIDVDIQKIINVLSLPICEELVVYQIENHKEQIREIIEQFMVDQDLSSVAMHDDDQIVIDM